MIRHWPVFLTISLLFPRWIQAGDTSSNSSPEPFSDEEWEKATVWDFFKWLQCDNVHLNNDNPAAFPIHGREVWNLLRKVYRETVGSESSIPPAAEDDMEPGTVGKTGWFVGTEVIKTKEKGRGTYVTEDVPKGAMVWTTKYTATFTRASQYRAFLKALPPSLVCELMTWSYTRIAPSGEFVICVDLEPGAFTNHASTQDELNLELATPENEVKNSGCALEYYATRDIPKGEELLIDYELLERNPGWVAMGLSTVNDVYDIEPISDELWETASVWDLFEWNQCDDVHLNDDNPDASPIHGREVWKLLRKVYRETVGSESSIPTAEEDDLEPTDGTVGKTGFLVGIEVVKTKEKGRGTYVTEDVPKGALVWTTKYTATFTTGNQYRTFLRAFPPSLVCELMSWSYTRIAPSGDFVICVDLEPGAFTNHASTREELNMQLGTPENEVKNTGCALDYYAPRDIPKGEELLMDYEFLERNPGWVAMGLSSPDDAYDIDDGEYDDNDDYSDEEEDEDYNDDEEEDEEELEEAEL